MSFIIKKIHAIATFALYRSYQLAIDFISNAVTNKFSESVAALETETRDSRQELWQANAPLAAMVAAQAAQTSHMRTAEEEAGSMRKRARNPEGQRLGLDEPETFEALVKEFKFASRVFGTSAFSRRRLEGALVFAGYVVKTHTLKNVLARHQDTFSYNEADDTYSLIF
ncbi:hypothetical protein A4X13_0g6304 [Tilletia indica]|uniref:Uncharacterized protein n=1 Tax=Tilletia indica TaxID=43049 RepID=A0A8T8SQD5_9BASI|nr:hypothetical protein A4X13_0g6304 [Tilletia indica]